MERYENIIKIEEIRNLTDDNQYVKALKILKTIDVNKIKSLTDLSIVADVYTQNEEYDDAMKILTRIYAKNKTRRIVYQLVDVSIKKGDIYESEYYLDKYKKLAPRDSYQYIFRYCIDKLKQEPYDVLMEPLEKLKEYEYFEVWAYELAKLYHKAGMKDRCVRECSDIILWFGNGIYVEKARLLKAYYVGEIDPIQMLKAKEKRDREIRLGLDKTKDYSSIRSEIDKFLAENEANEVNESKVIPFVAEDEAVNEVADEAVNEDLNEVAGEVVDNQVSPEDKEEKEFVQIWDSEELQSTRNSAYEELYSAGVFTDNNYEEENEYQEEKEYQVENDHEEENVQEEENEEHVTPVKESDLPIKVYDTSMYEKNELIPEVDSIQQTENIPEEDNASEYIASTNMTDMEESNMEESDISEDEIEHKIRLMNLKENSYLKKMFGYFACHDECRNQVESEYNSVLLKQSKNQNFIIIGQRKSGKTTLGKCYAKALYDQKRINSPKVAKISAIKLNEINLLERMNVLVDGTLIIEDAGKLTHNTVNQIIEAIKIYESRLIVILEDDKESIEELLIRKDKLTSVFEHVIRLPEFTRDDKLGFVLFFLDEQDYKLSGEGKEVLLKSLDEIEENIDEMDQLEALFDLVKKAKSSADKRNKSLLLDIIQSRNLETNDLIYIKEEDFYNEII